ncbi:MAG: hypothetical protein B7Z10_03095 [Rhodobacterales bacterium 32-66-7]|nr:MAG: hypothetical protein B7Z10_03095 [Rhodobacterales bacterium 32-66-7]
MANEVKLVSDSAELKRMVASYAAQNYTTVHSDERSAILSRRKKFNWVLAIICLFIPIIGWVALVLMIMAAGRGSEVVEVKIN